MLEKDQPVRDGSWTSAEIELINEKVFILAPCYLLLTLSLFPDVTHHHKAHNLPRQPNNERLPPSKIKISPSNRQMGD
jgi:hypothetical protein